METWVPEVHKLSRQFWLLLTDIYISNYCSTTWGKAQNGNSEQQRLRLDCVCTQSDQSICCLPLKYLYLQNNIYLRLRSLADHEGVHVHLGNHHSQMLSVRFSAAQPKLFSILLQRKRDRALNVLYSMCNISAILRKSYFPCLANYYCNHNNNDR